MPSPSVNVSDPFCLSATAVLLSSCSSAGRRRILKSWIQTQLVDRRTGGWWSVHGGWSSRARCVTSARRRQLALEWRRYAPAVAAALPSSWSTLCIQLYSEFTHLLTEKVDPAVCCMWSASASSDWNSILFTSSCLYCTKLLRANCKLHCTWDALRSILRN